MDDLSLHIAPGEIYGFIGHNGAGKTTTLRSVAGIQQLAGDATLLYYTTDEAKEGRGAFKEKRAPDFTQYPKFP